MDSFKLWGGRALNILIVVAIGFLIYQHFQKPPVVSVPHNEVTTASGLIKVTLANNFKISKYQAESFSEQIRKSEGKPPSSTIATTGSAWEEMAKKQASKVGADFSLVTDPSKPNQKPNPPKDCVVSLNQYNLMAYPKKLATVAYAPSKELMASYQWKIIKGSGWQGYVGPYGRFDLNDSKGSSAGIMITVAH